MSTSPVAYPYSHGISKLLLKAKQLAAYTFRTAQGRVCPMPDILKHSLLRRELKRHGLKVFVETGTYMGDTVNAVKGLCDEVYSVEVQQHLYELAKERFADSRNVHILKGNSADVLPGILASFNRAALFWLDGHFPGVMSRSDSSEAQLTCPVFAELSAIFAHRKDHVILIDDARDFVGTRGYPTVAEVETFLKQHSRSTFSIRDDIMRIEP